MAVRGQRLLADEAASQKMTIWPEHSQCTLGGACVATCVSQMGELSENNAPRPPGASGEPASTPPCPLHGACAPGALGADAGPPLPTLHPLLQAATPHPVRPHQTRPTRGVSPPARPACQACRGVRHPPQSPVSVPMSQGWAQPSYRGAQGSAPDSCKRM